MQISDANLLTTDYINTHLIGLSYRSQVFASLISLPPTKLPAPLFCLWQCCVGSSTRKAETVFCTQRCGQGKMEQSPSNSIIQSQAWMLDRYRQSDKLEQLDLCEEYDISSHHTLLFLYCLVPELSRYRHSHRKYM